MGTKSLLLRIVTDEFAGGQRPDGKDGSSVATGKRLIVIHRPEGQLHGIGIAPAPQGRLFFDGPQIGRSLALRPKYIVMTIGRPGSAALHCFSRQVEAPLIEIVAVRLDLPERLLFGEHGETEPAIVGTSQE